MIDKPGKYKISFEEYLADPCPEPSLTRSTIKTLIEHTPRHAFYGHPRLNPNLKKDEAVKFDFGTLAHALFLEGVDRAVVIDAADWRTKAAKEERDAARENGLIPMLADQYAEVKAMVYAANEALADWEGRGLQIADGEPEATYIWHEKNGVWCRCRPDWSMPGLWIDFKSTQASADTERYNRIATDTGLDIQDAFYRRGGKAIDGEEPRFVFMTQEIYEPYLCSFFELDMITRDMGEDKVRRSIKAWGKHLKTGEWPGYGANTHTMEFPGWALAAWETKKFTLDAAEGVL